MRDNPNFSKEVNERYYAQLIPTMMSHDGEKIEAFAKDWGLRLRNNKTSVIYSYETVCNDAFYPQKEREKAERWLVDHGYHYLIQKAYLN